MSGPRRPPIAARLFAALLRLVPRSFRARFGAEMRITFAARYDAARGKGPWTLVMLTLRELGGLVAVAWRARRASFPLRGHRGRAHPVESRRANLMETTFRDVRHAARSLARNPVLATAVIAVAGIGIGAATAIFSAVDAALFRPLPVHDPDRLVMVWEENPERGWYKQTAAPANFLDWRAQVGAFADAGAYSEYLTGLTLTGRDEPEWIETMPVTGNLFDVLGVQTALGRTFEERETWSGAPPVVLLTDAFWERRFGRDPAAIGSRVTLDGVAYEVVGVMPRGFTFPGQRIDAFVPFRWAPAEVDRPSFRRAHYIRVIARLDPGATHAQAATQLDAVAARLQAQYPELNRRMGAGLTPLHEFVVGDSRTPLLLLFGATGLLLLLTCANVANLLLVRAAGRWRDLAVRSALGAGAGRLVRQLLTESMLLAGMGGAIGVAFGVIAVRALAAFAPDDLAGFDRIGVDARVLAFALAVTLLTGAAFGLLPALRSARADAADALREGARTGGTGPGRRRAAQALVVAEVALALVIVTGAGLLVRSFLALRSVDPGFRTEQRISARVSLPATRYDSPERTAAFTRALIERLETLGGVERATLASKLPLTGQSWTSDFRVRGEQTWGTEVVHRTVDDAYFALMGVPLLAGRAFSAADALGGERVLVINDALRRQHFGEADPIGKHIAFTREPTAETRWYRIIGVVGDERQNGLAQPPRMEVFESARQDARCCFTLVLHTSVPPTAVIPAVRAALATLDPALPLFEVQTLEDVHAAALARDRFLLLLFTGFAAIALILAVLGVYGVAAEAARGRTQEIGIRVALGATRSDVLWLVLRGAAAVVSAGVVLGLAGGLAAAGLMRDLLFAVTPRDLMTFALVPTVIAAAALVASWLPASRAARLDAARAMRAE